MHITSHLIHHLSWGSSILNLKLSECRGKLNSLSCWDRANLLNECAPTALSGTCVTVVSDKILAALQHITFLMKTWITHASGHTINTVLVLREEEYSYGFQFSKQNYLWHCPINTNAEHSNGINRFTFNSTYVFSNWRPHASDSNSTQTYSMPVSPVPVCLFACALVHMAVLNPERPPQQHAHRHEQQQQSCAAHADIMFFSLCPCEQQKCVRAQSTDNR